MKWTTFEAPVLIAVFCLSEALWYAVGIRFDHADAGSTPLHNYVQYVDADLLRERFFETLLYLHIQPPLFHAFLGTVLQFPETWHTLLFGTAYSAMSLGLVLGARALLADFGVDRWIRLVVCVLLIFSPPLVLLAKWLYVQMPVATLLVCGALMLHRAVRGAKLRYYLGYGLCAAGAALITSYFHLLWLLVILSLPVIVLMRGKADGAASRRRWLLAAAWAPALLVVSVYVKNWLLFDRFVASTWSSVAPSRTARAAVGPKVIDAWIEAGRISPFMRRENDIQYLAMDRILELERGEPLTWDVPVLDQTHRSSGKINFNYSGLLPVYRRLAEDTRRLVAAYPGAWLKHAGESFCKYQAPATWSAYAVGKNRQRIRFYSELFEYLIWGKALGYYLGAFLGHFEWVTFPTVFVPVLLVHAARSILRPRRFGRLGEADRMVIAFLAVNLLYVAAVAIVVADNEHERYHFFSDALLYLLACRACAAWFGRLTNDAE